MRVLSSRPARAALAAVAGATLALVARSTALAQEAGAEGGTAGTDVGGGVSTFGVGDWLGLGVRLALVVAVIWVAVAGMRWYVRRVHQGGRRGGLGALEVIETHALGPNRTLHLVRLGDRAVLVGATPERITQLMTVDDPEELQRLVERPTEEAPRVRTAGGLASVLSSLGAGLVAMNARRREMNERIRAQRETQGAARRQDAREDSAPATPRFAGLRAALARANARPARTSRRQAEATQAESRQSLFDRTLASIDAVQVQGVPTAAGLRARAGYGRGGADAAGDASGLREAQIAELQRAIAAARRNAG